MTVLHRYLIVFVAGACLLGGIQIPNFVDQYEKRLDAHLREVSLNLAPFQAVADRYHGGSLAELIALHRRSPVPSFREEGEAIAAMAERKRRFEAERRGLDGMLLWRVLYIAVRGDRELRDETRAQYSASVPLNQNALVSGVALAGAAVLLLEGLLALLRSFGRAVVGLGRRSGRRPGQSPDRRSVMHRL